MGKVMGFKVYFNTSKLKFMCEKTASEVEHVVQSDSCVSWSDTYQHGVEVADHRNDKMEQKRIYVRICRACGTPFMVDESGIAWYNDKGYRLPRRCEACRKKYRYQTINGEEKEG